MSVTKQELFDRAWNGLKSQDWEQSVDGTCVYYMPGTPPRRCAWGWCDPEGTQDQRSDIVFSLASRGIGLAARLSATLLEFASELQVAHDGADRPSDMRERFEHLAQRHGLTIPAE